MKITPQKISIILIILLFPCMYVHAEDNVSVDLKNVSLKTALEQFCKQTDMTLSYSPEFVDTETVVSLSVKEEPVSAALKKLLYPVNIDFKISGKEILLFPKPSSGKSTSETNSSPRKKFSGTVTDTNGDPIIGATVLSTKDNIASVTDIDGIFSIEVPENTPLTISYIGYRQAKVVPHNNMKIVLEEKNELLDEIVVVGYGTQKKVNLTGAVSIVSEKDLNDRPVASAAMALQGTDPGMNLTLNSGSPDAGYNINIRGISSLTSGASPLVLIDGVEGSLSRINANDIESVSILKDASAAAIYGAKASAGVILVTTKSGKEGASKIKYSYRFGISQNTTSTDYITTGYWSAKINDMFMQPYKGYGYTNYTDEDYAELYARINDKTENPARPWAVKQADGSYKYYANFDWYDYMYRRSRPQQEHNLSISGGNEKINYYVSGRYFHQDGIIKLHNDTYDNFSIRSKIGAHVTKWLKFTNNTSYYASKRFFPGMSSMANTLRLSYVHALACIPATNPDGSAVYINPNSNATATVMDGVSALLLHDKHRNTNYDHEIITSNRFDFQLYKGLNLVAEYAYTFRFREYNNRSANVPYSEKEGEIEWLTTEKCLDYYQEQHYRVQNHNANIYATYDTRFGDGHTLKLMAGGQYEDYRNRNMKARQLDLKSDDLDAFDLATGEVTILNGSIKEWATLGFFGRVNYDYQGKYLVELSARTDGSSRFARKHRWVFVPSGSIGWRISEEKFWKPLSHIWDNCKIRLSVGSLGNQNVDDCYTYIESINTNGTINYTIDGESKVNIATEDDPKAADLTWETATTYDLGLDLGFFGNRLTITGDAYIRDTKNMLCDGMQLPSVYGAEVPRQNIADMRTRGWELSIGWQDQITLVGKPFSYSVSAGISDYITKITRYNNPSKLLSKYYVGQTLGELWGFSVGGLFASDEEAANYPVDQTYLNQQIITSVGEPGLRAGDVKYLDLDGDNVISIGANTLDNPGDQKIIGNTLPRYAYNFKLSASWYGVDISAFFQGIGHQDWYPSGNSISFWGPYSRPYCSFIPSNFMDNVWSETNRNAYFPRARGYEALQPNYSMGSPNDRYLQNIAYFRLKNLTIGYTVPLPKGFVKDLRIYLTGENLFYFSPLKKHSKYVDPEQATSTDTRYENSGVSYNFNKTFSIGASITL